MAKQVLASIVTAADKGPAGVLANYNANVTKANSNFGEIYDGTVPQQSMSFNGYGDTVSYNGGTARLECTSSFHVDGDITTDGDMTTNGLTAGSVTMSTGAGAGKVGVSTAGGGLTWTAVTAIDFSTLGNYADDVAAAAGGVAVGKLYHNAGALRVRVA